MYCDEVRGIFPLLIFPDESIKNSEYLMRPINFHPIWFLDTERETDSEHVDLTYNGKIYFAKKFRIVSEVGKKKGEYKETPFNMMAVITVFPKEMSIYKNTFSKIISEAIIKDFKDYFHKIIKSEKLKTDLIKIPRNEKFIKEGDFLKEIIKNFLDIILQDRFSFLKHYSHKGENMINLES
ncbi:MAG: hypothetical protein KGD58_02195 [Candidatus Lokiarchaeota archaeon]|nr:hypothetical protein [Candidatus Lokiarchaeota archaeon]